MSGTPEELDGLLVNVHVLLKSQLTKELTSVVRYSQETKRASWRPEKRPNWWCEGKVIDAVDVSSAIPAYGPTKTLSANDMRAALVSFYISRIHYDTKVSPTADEIVEEESAHGKNPFPPEHYGDVQDGADEQLDKKSSDAKEDNEDKEIISETDSDYAVEDEAERGPPADVPVESLAEVEEDKQVGVEDTKPRVKHTHDSDDDNVAIKEGSEDECREESDEEVETVDKVHDGGESGEEDVDDNVVENDVVEDGEEEGDEEDEEQDDVKSIEGDSEAEDVYESLRRDSAEVFDLEAYHQLFNRIKDDPAENRFRVLRMMLVQVMEEQEGRTLTRNDKELRIRLGFESAKAKVRSDYETIRRRKLQELEKTKSALRVQMQKTLARIPADIKNMHVSELDELAPCDTLEEVVAQLREKRRRETAGSSAPATQPATRRTRRAGLPPCPATEARRPRRGAAQSAAAKNRALLVGTPSRARLENEELFTENGTVVHMLYSKNKSPISVDDAVPPTPAPRSGRARLPRGKPPSGASSRSVIEVNEDEQAQSARSRTRTTRRGRR